MHQKYVGTGNAETNKYDWMQAQHRDSLASYVGHNTLLAYMAVAENESMARLKLKFQEVFVVDC